MDALPRELPPVASRSLFEGIFTVRRIDLGESPVCSAKDRDIVTEVDETARLRLVDLTGALESGSSGSSRPLRARSERRKDMAGSSKWDSAGRSTDTAGN